MAALSDYLENKLIDFLFRGQAYSPPATLHIGLMTALPSDTGGGTEVSGGAYVREPVTSSLANWAGTQGAGTTAASSGTGGTTSNNIELLYPTPTASWGTVVGFGIYDASTGGNLLVYGSLSSSQAIQSGDTVRFNAGSLSIQIDN